MRTGTVAIALLALAACSSTPGARQGSSASPLASARPRGTAAAPASGAASPAVSISPRDEPVAVVLALLKAIDADNYPLQREIARGPALTLLQIRLIARSENERRGGVTDDMVTVTSTPKLRSLSGDTAVVDVSASIRSEVIGRGGGTGTVHDIGPPIVLRVMDGLWRVVNMSYDEGALQDLVVSGSDETDGFTLEITRGLSYGSATTLMMRLSAPGGPMIVRVRSATLHTADGAEHDLQTAAFDDGDPPIGFLAFGKVTKRLRSLEASIDRDGTQFNFEMDLR